jgi:N-methylhydantoinase B/oxoprolinase/acetone carboxylase alpha subunit
MKKAIIWIVVLGAAGVAAYFLLKKKGYLKSGYWNPVEMMDPNKSVVTPEMTQAYVSELEK